MTDGRKTPGETRLSRWSRLKREHRASPAPTDERLSEATPPLHDQSPAAANPALDRSAPSQTTADTPEANNEADHNAPLPDIETLDKDSDFTVFLNETVPEELRRRALRSLWRSDPVLANLDGLNDYDEDFSMVGTVREVVHTLYNAGKGYVSEAHAADENERAGTATEGMTQPGPAASDPPQITENDDREEVRDIPEEHACTRSFGEASEPPSERHLIETGPDGMISAGQPPHPSKSNS